MEAEAVIEVMSKFADALCWISFSCKVGNFVTAIYHLTHKILCNKCRTTCTCVMERLLLMLFPLLFSPVRLDHDGMNKLLNYCTSSSQLDFICMQVVAVGVNCTAPWLVEVCLVVVVECVSKSQLVFDY